MVCNYLGDWKWHKDSWWRLKWFVYVLNWIVFPRNSCESFGTPMSLGMVQHGHLVESQQHLSPMQNDKVWLCTSTKPIELDPSKRSSKFCWCCFEAWRKKCLDLSCETDINSTFPFSNIPFCPTLFYLRPSILLRCLDHDDELPSWPGEVLFHACFELRVHSMASRRSGSDLGWRTWCLGWQWYGKKSTFALCLFRLPAMGIHQKTPVAWCLKLAIGIVGCDYLLYFWKIPPATDLFF